MGKSNKELAALTVNQHSMVRVGLEILQAAIAANNFEKGWRTKETDHLGIEQKQTFNKRPVGELIALLHSEVTECFESYRNNEPTLHYKYPGYAPARFELASERNGVLGKPEGMASELADVIIRVFDMADELEIPVIQAVLEKHAYNQTRAYKHGGKAC